MPDGSSILIECPIFMIFDVQYTEPSLDYLGTYNADNIYYDYIYIDYSTDDGFNVIFGYYGEDYSYQPLFNVYCETINDFVVVGRTFGNKSSFINVIRYIDDIIGQEQQILIDISYADLFPNTEYNYNYTTFVYADYTQVNDYYTTNQYTTYTDRYDTYEYYTYTQSYDSDCIVESTDIRSYNMSFIDPLFSFYELEINEWYGYILDVFGVDTTQHTILLYLLYYPIYLLWFELLHVISLCFSFIPKLFNRWLNKVGDE